MNTYFKTNIETYEQIRNEMDNAFGYPNHKATTSFTPATEALKDKNGDVLIGVIQVIAEQFLKAGVQQITEEEYRSNMPTLSGIQ
jgi:hypothetical protein